MQLGMDGPNVNTSFKRKKEEALKNKYNGKIILDLGTCNLHKVNNSFLQTIAEIPFDDGFALDFCFFFKISSGRRADLSLMSMETEIEAESLLRHSRIRWLSIGKSAQRIVNDILRYLQYLHPNLRTNSKALSSIRTLSDKIYQVLANTDEIKISHAKLTEKIEFENRLFQTTPNLDEMQESIDVYWHSIGEKKIKRRFNV